MNRSPWSWTNRMGKASGRQSQLPELQQFGSSVLAIAGSREQRRFCVPGPGEGVAAQRVGGALDASPWLVLGVCPCWHWEHWGLLFFQLFSPWMQKNRVPVSPVLAACAEHPREQPCPEGIDRVTPGHHLLFLCSTLLLPHPHSDRKGLRHF